MKLDFRSSLLPSYFMLFGFSVFLIGGNLLRIFPVSGAFGNINFGELILYCFAFLLFPFFLKGIMSSETAIVLLGVNFTSLLLGLIENGFLLKPIFYNLRLGAQIFSCLILASALFTLFEGRVGKAVDYYLKNYFAVCLISFIILVLFPDSTVLWSFLARHDVLFIGDPHQYRLVSVYLDPNFFSTIIVLPLVWSLYKVFYDSRIKYKIYFVAFSLALMLSVSRSGISLAILCVSAVSLVWLLTKITTGVVDIKKKVLSMMAAILVFCSMVVFFFNGYIFRVFERFINTSSDPSAGSRVDSFFYGFKLLENHPLLGYGYNFSLEYINKGEKIDSSLQLLLISYGLVGCFFVFSFMMYKFWCIRRNLRKKRGEIVYIDIFIIYVILALFWAGNFNQIVFYQFWFIPVLVLLFYFEILSKKRAR